MRTLTILAFAAVLAGSLPAPAAPVCQDPRLLVLFDSSGSLGLKSNAASNYNAAVNAVEAVTAAEGSHIEFGMLVFPSDPGAVNCQTTSTLAVPFALDNGPAFKAFFDGFAGPHSYSDTPMLQVLRNVADAKASQSGIGYLKDTSVPGHVLLVTDGSQDCCFDEYYGTGFGWNATPDCNWGEHYGSTNYWNQLEFQQNRTDLIALVTKLRGQGLSVWVVGFGTKVDPQALNDMAVAGGTPRVKGCGVGAAAGACYYQAGSPAELSAALSSIAKQVGEESCNGLDDDCDGQTDEDVTRECATACGTGVETCTLGTWGGCTAGEPQDETCDGTDEDCDGRTDEDLWDYCYTECGWGEVTCENGEWVGCTTDPLPETCNGLDDNCDGSTDEGCDCVTGTVEDCGPSLGNCEPGKRSCIDGKWSSCTGGITPKAEACNDQDDDCDGTTDGQERSCHTTCGTGKETCTHGQWIGCTAPQPQQEACNNQDDDCDGTIDHGVQACQTACGTGTEQCIGGQWVGCTAPQPGAETCNGQDDDCDGLTDEDEETRIPCASDCGKGFRKCRGGLVGTCEITEPMAEACDGLDNDCNGTVDDGTTCPADGKCICGGCAQPAAEDGSCVEGTPLDGFCVVDKCPPGKWCQEGECVEGTPPEVEPDAAGGTDTGGSLDVPLVGLPEKATGEPAGGCGCEQAGSARPAPFEGLLLLAAMGLLAWRRLRAG